MAIITKIDGGKQAITFNNDNEPVAVYIDGQLQENISFVPKSATGTTTVSYTSEYKKNLLELDIEGNTEQKQLTGKNLFDLSKNRYSGVPTIVEKTQNSITVSGSNSWQSVNIEIPNFKDLIGKAITISANISKTGSTNAGLYVRWFNNHAGVGNNAKNIGVYGANAVGYVSKSGVVQDLDFEQYPNAKLCVAFYANTDGTNDASASITYSNVQVEFGSTPTEYEEYCGGIPSPNPQYPQEIQNADNMSVELSVNESITNIQIPSEITSTTEKPILKDGVPLVNGTVVPLRFGKVDTYTDKLMVDKINNKVVYQENTLRIELNRNSEIGGWVWEYNSYMQSQGKNIYGIGVYKFDVVNDKGFCNYFIRKKWGTPEQQTFYVVNNALWFATDLQETLDDWKLRLDTMEANGIPLEVLVARKTPIEYDLTNTDLGRELLALANRTQNATNTITITSDLPASKVNVKYAKWGGRDENLS